MRTIAVMLLVLASTAHAGTIQQDFDAAQALLDAGKAAEARDAFTALLKRFRDASRSRSANVVRLRLGTALAALGETEAAEPQLAAAAAALTQPADREEQAYARYRLAAIAESYGKIDSAARGYREVLDSGAMAADTPQGISLRAALARTLIWSAPDEARQLADALLALPPEKLAKGDTRALVESLRARIDLNNGRPYLARRRLLAAAGIAGGATTLRINAADMRVRGDLLIASHLTDNREEIAKFVAFSGAGYLLKAGLATPTDRNLPACAPLTTVATDAVAVIEFSIAETGKVYGVTPVYAAAGAGGRAAGDDTGPESVFVQAVRSWSWRADEAAKVEPFWRQVIRMEIRCQTGRGGFDPVDAAFYRAETEWYDRVGLVPAAAAGSSDAASLPVHLAELQAREKAHGTAAAELIPVLRVIGWNQAAAPDVQDQARRRRLALLKAAAAPAAAIGIVEIGLAIDPFYRSRNPADANMAELRRLVAHYDAAGETRLAMLARLRLAEVHLWERQRDTAAAVLADIVAAPETQLSAADPIRTAALLRRADVAAQQKDLATATAALAATGLTAAQCALVDVRPSPLNNSVTAKSFPQLALRYATSGAVGVGYDITADGRTTGVRTVWAMPPFLFDADTEAAIAKFRFTPMFRPGSSTGCTGSVQAVRFLTSK